MKKNEIFPENHKIYDKDRLHQEGGGVLLAIRNDFISDEAPKLSPGMILVKLIKYIYKMYIAEIDSY